MHTNYIFKNVSYTVFNFLYVVVAGYSAVHKQEMSAFKHLSDTFIFISCKFKYSFV